MRETSMESATYPARARRATVRDMSEMEAPNSLQ
jgi:hypothetical protein